MLNATSVEASFTGLQALGAAARRRVMNGLPGGNSEREPPDPIPNSEVKTSSADGSVPCHMRE